MVNSENRENTARHLLKDAARGRGFSEAYNKCLAGELPN